MIPEGKHKARGVQAALGMTGTGKEQVGVLCEITQGEHAGEQLTWYGFFTDATVERTMESLRTLGWEGDDLTDLRGIDANEVQIDVEHEQGSDGKTRPRIKWINRGGAGLAMKETLNEGAAKAFAAKMRGFAVASRNRAKAGGVTKTEHRAPANGVTPRGPQRTDRDEPPPFDPDDLGF